MDAGFYIYRGPRDSFALPGMNTKKLARDGEAVELDRREASICGRYAHRGHRFEFVGSDLPAEVEEEVDTNVVSTSMTVADLQEVAAHEGIDLTGSRTKAEIIAAIEAHRANTDA